VPSDQPEAKISLRGPEGDVETLWAFELGGDLYRLDNTPFYAYGISWQDGVEARPDDDGQLFLVKLVEKSGNRTLRISGDEPFADEWLEKIVALGATYEGANRKYIGINVPRGLDLDVVIAFLVEEGVAWEYADPTYEEIHGSGAAP
jgi:hypothetical protein